MSPELLFVIALVSSVIVWILKFAFVNKEKPVPAWVYTIALGVVSLLLALVFVPVALPPFPSFDGSLLGLLGALLVYAGSLLPVLSASVGFATLIYQALLKKVMDGLASATKSFLQKRGLVAPDPIPEDGDDESA